MLRPLEYNIETPQPESLSGFQFLICQSGAILSVLSAWGWSEQVPKCGLLLHLWIQPGYIPNGTETHLINQCHGTIPGELRDWN